MFSYICRQPKRSVDSAKLPFGGELDFVPISPCLLCNSQKRVIFPGIIDVNFEVGWMNIDRLRDQETVDLPLEVAVMAA